MYNIMITHDKSTIPTVDETSIIDRECLKPHDYQCLPQGVLIHTTQGLVPVENMTTGHHIQTHLGVYEVMAVMARGKQPLVYIETSIGHIKCTAEHEVAVWCDVTKNNDNMYIWKAAKDLCVTDNLTHITHIVEGHDTTIDDIEYAPPLDDDSAFFLGYSHGNIETCECIVRNDENGVRGSVTFNYNDFLIFLKPENFKFSLKLDENCFTIGSSSYAHHIHTVIQSGRIPKYILQASIDVRRSYIHGYEKSKYMKYGIITNIMNNTFLYNLQSIYSSLGVRTSIDIIEHTLKIIDTSYIGQSIIEYFKPPSIITPIKITNIRKTCEHLETYSIIVKDIEQCVVGGGLLIHTEKNKPIDSTHVSQ